MMGAGPSVRLRDHIYGTVLSGIAVGAGLVSSELFGFNWVIVSLLLLGIANLFALASRYHHYRPNLPDAPTLAGSTMINALVGGQRRRRYVPNRHQPTDRYTRLTQPMLVAVVLILAASLLT